MIRQALTGTLLMDLAADGGSTLGASDIRVYHRPDPLPAKVNGLYPTVGLTPHRTGRVEALAVDGTGAVTRLLATWDPDGSAATADQQRWVWEWVDEASGGPGWKMGEGVDASGDFSTAEAVETKVEAEEPDGRIRRTRTVEFPSAGAPAAEVQELRESFAWGTELVERVADPDGAGLRTAYTYYDDEVGDGDDYAMMRSMIDENGRWEHYRYDASKRRRETIGQLGSNVYDPSDLTALRAANVVRERLRIEPELNDADTSAERVERVRITVAGVLERSVYEVRWSQSYPGGSDDPSVYEVWRIDPAVADPEAAYADTEAFLNALLADADDLGHAVTKTRRYETGEAEEYELVEIEHADGRVSRYDYPSDGVTVVTRGYLNGAGTDVVHGSRSTSTVDVANNPVSTYVEMIDPDVNSGAWFVGSLSKTLTSDAFGRPTSTGYYYGAEASAE
ncbi:MAG: hypothetical protein AAF593_13015, partial [Planctomycetota bacterium]